uniref:Uncharacterized protein n=1 Tax=Arundo donax TaxID=35708 RepID=A0A0A9UD71_ARUDO
MEVARRCAEAAMESWNRAAVNKEQAPRRAHDHLVPNKDAHEEILDPKSNQETQEKPKPPSTKLQEKPKTLIKNKSDSTSDRPLFLDLKLRCRLPLCGWRRGRRRRGCEPTTQRSLEVGS